MAKEKGYYKNIGFDVELKEFTNHTNTLQDILYDKTTFGISNSLLMIERQDYDVVLLANYFKQSPLVIATTPKIKHPKDLEFKSFMSSKQRLINTPIDFMFKHLGVKYSKINFIKNTYNIQDFIDKKIDAMEIYKTNELYRLKNENIAYNLIEPKDYGFNSGAVNMFTVQNNIDKYGNDKIKAFINATNKGWKYALEHIDETTNLIFKKYNNSLKKSKKALLFEAIETKKLFLLDQYKIGEINNEELYRWYNILNNYGLVKDSNKFDEFLFNKNWKEKVYTKKDIDIIVGIVIFIIIIMLIIVYFSKSKAKLLEVKNKEIMQVEYHKKLSIKYLNHTLQLNINHKGQDLGFI